MLFLPSRARTKSAGPWTARYLAWNVGRLSLGLPVLQIYLGWRSTPRKVASVPHIPLLAENNTRKGFFEHDQFLAMRRALPEHLRPVLTFAYYTGCRRGEILALGWEQVDLVERAARLEAGTTKNDEARILPLTEELYQVLSMQRSIRDAKHPGCPWVFFTEAGEQVRNFRRSWETACKAAKLTDAAGDASRLFHDLRRSGVRNLVRAGVPEAVAMRISGHKTRSVFDRYNIVSERDLKDAARRLETYIHAKEQGGAGAEVEEPVAKFGHTLGTPEGKTGAPEGAKLLQ